MPASIYHQLTATTPDDTRYEIRPSHFNQAHVVTLSADGSEIVGAFSNANGLSFGLSAGQVTGSYTVPSVAGLVSAVNVSAGTTSNNLSALTFNNGNNVTFGLNGSVITASVNSSYRASNDAIGLNTAQSNVTWTVNSSGLSLDARGYAGTATGFTGANISGSMTNNSNGLSLSLSVAPAGGGADGYNILAAGSQTANTTGTVVFSNSNGLTFGMSNNSVITGSYTVPAQTNQTVGGYAVGNTTGQSSSSTIDARSISIDGAGLISVGWSNGTLRVSGTQSNQAVSAANGSYAFQTLSFSNANGVSFGTSAGSAVTASYTVPSVTEYFSKTNTTFNGANISGSLTLNTNGLQVSLSVAPGGGGADGYNILAAGTQTAATTGTVSFANSNGISFGMSNSSIITASYTVPTQTNQTIGGYVVGNTTGQSSSSTVDARSISIDGAGIVSAGWSNGTIRVSATQSNQAWSGSNASSTFQTLSFGNANGASWSNNGGAVNLSYTVPTVTNSSMTVSDAGTSGTLARLAFTNLNGVTLSLSTGAGGSHTIVGSHNALTSQSNQAVSAANGSYAFQTLSFSNANGMSFGTSAGSAITGSYTVPSVTEYFSKTNTTFNGTNVSGSLTLNTNGLQIDLSVAAGGGGVTPVASASNGSFSFTTIAFSNANNVTFGTSAGSIITASVAAPGGGGFTNSYFNPQDAYLQVTGQQGQNTLHIQPVKAPNVTYDRLVFPIYNSGASNSNGTASLTMRLGIYTNNAGTLSLSTSYSGSASWHNNSQNSSSLFRGIRLMTVGATDLLTEGQYWVGILSSTATASNNQTLNQVLCSQLNSNFSGMVGESIANSVQYTRGLGRYSATTGGLPGSINFSEIYGTQSLVLRLPLFYFLNGTN